MPSAIFEFQQPAATVKVFISSRETGGEYTVCAVQVPASIEIPAHQHNFEDQWYMVVSGCFAFTVGGQTVDAGPGVTVPVPRQTLLRIGCSGPGQLLVFARPGGFDLFFGDAHSADESTLGAVLEKHGILLA